MVLAALFVSNPKIPVMDMLNRFATDEDPEFSKRAILALGLIGAGTNNSRLGNLLKNLDLYYDDENFTDHTFAIKMAMGFLHTGKGTMTS